MTNLDQTGRERLEPRPVSRPPVDPAAKRAFGRPDGVNGSFLNRGQNRDQGEYAPKDQPPDPVLAEAFGRPHRGGDSLQRHPTDAGALDAERDGAGEDVDDPWRNPGAPVALGTPAVTQTAPAAPTAPAGKLGVRDVLFGGKVSWFALVILGIVALVIGIVIGVVFRPSVPEVIQPYLPIAVVAALDAVFGGLRAYLENIFDAKVFVVSFVFNVVVAAVIVYVGDQLGVGTQLSTAIIVVLGIRIFGNAAALRRRLFGA